MATFVTAKERFSSSVNKDNHQYATWPAKIELINFDPNNQALPLNASLLKLEE